MRKGTGVGGMGASESRDLQESGRTSPTILLGRWELGLTQGLELESTLRQHR
jgi:hypothetical protein